MGNRGIAMKLLIVAALCVAASAIQLEEGTPVDLSMEDHPPPHAPAAPRMGKMSLVQLKEAALMAVHGEVAMTDAMVQKAKHSIINLAAAFKSDALRTESITTVRLAQKVLLGEGSKQGAKVQGSGLDLIFRKLDELLKKIKNEQKEELAANSGSRAECQKIVKDNNKIIESTSSARASNARAVALAHIKISKNRASWVVSRNLEDKVHKALVEMQAARAEESDAVRARVDERNKAIDVMVKATFMVCERFNRYKDTAQCQEIKSQPDVDEPNRYETKPYNKAKKETEEAHKKGTKWAEDWKKQEEKDIKLEGKPNPEGLIKAPKAAAPAKKPATVELLEEEEEDENTALNTSEMAAYRELTLLTKTAKLPSKYSLPLSELALSLKAGDTARSKSIVEILLQVLKETREEQAEDKRKHTENLNSYYKQSLDQMKILNEEAAKQAQLRSEMESARELILHKMIDSETQRKNQNQALAARTLTEDRCATTNEEYGVREALRLEDLENIAKLKSLLRALYDKKMPTACPKHNRVMCSSKENGWCIYAKRKPSNEQRCSCNVGFYGEACQFRMCPGLSKNLYQAGATGVCSERGACNPLNGLCHCRVEYYHGPKTACDYKHAPKSKNGEIDNKCTSRGALDKIRGVCNCRLEFYGPGCEQKRCPNSNGVLYPLVSGNACNGRGACSIENGKCTCGVPYSGTSCEFESCPENCRGRGGCNTATGKCACKDPFFGPACEFRTCPFDCSGGGQCNRNDGLCVCNMGYSGKVCQKTSRCAAQNLNSNKMNWWTVWDKPGWMVCPKGQLMYQMKRSLCQALSCIESGGCAAGCEGQKHVFQLRHCYHDLRWYNSFDMTGWSKCLPDYFVAGLFRSCESLYCLNMAKCCSLKEARWAQCGEANWAQIFNGPGTGKLPNAHSFITGFRRDEGQSLKNLEGASYCGFVRGY